MKILALITSSLVVLLSTSAYAYVAGERIAPSFHVGTYDMHYFGEYFFSEKNIGGTYGDVDSLVGESRYSEFASRLEAGYTFNLPARAFGFGKANFVNTTSLNGVTFNDKNISQFNALGVGGQYFIKTKALLIIPEFFYEHNLEDYEDNQFDPITSDATSAIQFGSYLASFIWKFKSEAYIGYRYHAEDLSDLMLWSWRLAFRLSKWSLTGSLAGAVAVTDDVNKDFVVNRYNTFNFVNGGSFRHRAINPQWVDAGFEGAYKFDDKMSAVVGFKQTVTGRNTAQGTSILIGFNAEFGENQSGNQNSLNGAEFQPELEDYDKTIFE